MILENVTKVSTLLPNKIDIYYNVTKISTSLLIRQILENVGYFCEQVGFQILSTTELELSPSPIIGSTGLHCPPLSTGVLSLSDTEQKAERACQKFRYPKGFTGRFRSDAIQFQKCRKSSCDLVFLSASLLPSLSNIH